MVLASSHRTRYCPVEVEAGQQRDGCQRLEGACRAQALVCVLCRENVTGVGIDDDPGGGSYVGWLAAVDDHAGGDPEGRWLRARRKLAARGRSRARTPG